MPGGRRRVARWAHSLAAAPYARPGLTLLGRDPVSRTTADLDRAAAAVAAIRPLIRKFHSSEYISDLANGDLCVAFGYSGDMIQARNRAAEAKNGVIIAHSIRREGAMVILPFWTSFLIRVYAWIGLLKENVPSTTRFSPWASSINRSSSSTTFAVCAGIVYSYFPLMVLPLPSSKSSIRRCSRPPPISAAARGLVTSLIICSFVAAGDGLCRLLYRLVWRAVARRGDKS